MIRNPVFNAYGTIDCEVEHPTYGWIPFTASPDDVEEHGKAIYAAALAMGPAEYVAPEPEPEFIRVPQVISRFQGRTALKRNGLYQAAEAAISQADEFTQDAWSDATEWRRNSVMIASMGEALGLSSEQIDGLFIEASLIEA